MWEGFGAQGDDQGDQGDEGDDQGDEGDDQGDEGDDQGDDQEQSCKTFENIQIWKCKIFFWNKTLLLCLQDFHGKILS